MKNIILIIVLISSLSLKSFGQWKSTYGPVTGRISAFAMDQGNVFAAANGGTVFMNPNNSGNYWKQCYSGMLSPMVLGIIKAFDKVFAVSDKIYFFDYSDSSWVTSAICNGTGFRCISADSHLLLAGTYNDGVYVSFDSGNTWQNRSSGLPLFQSEYEWMHSVYACNNMLFAGYENDIAISHDSGASWTVSNISGMGKIFKIVNIDTRLFVCGEFGMVKYSNDKGVTWSIYDSIPLAYDLLLHNGVFYASCSHAIFYSEDKGKTWAYDSFSNPSFFATLGILDDIMYGGTGDGFIWTKKMTSSIDQEENHFEILTFPNPVEDKLFVYTEDQYAVRKVEMYDIQGRQSGVFHSAEIDLSEYQSGLYLMKIELSDGEIILKKIMKR